ncbi:hypothetical protein [Curtobacterium ammoniigenes]|uniref:hypothetical protein n=1 Tax=Curtobacterium ammoniigenes TaxID=395387 RepID=UPI000832AB9B|nr:hypothetical protein [Curtobacterium ammoniigenes]
MPSDAVASVSAPRHQRRGGRGTLGQLVPIGVIALPSALAWSRLPAIARGTLWGEDGKFFLADNLQHGSLGSLFIPYQGYLHLVPRLIVDVAVHITPIGDFARTITAITVLVVGGVGALVYVLSRDVIDAPAMRLALAVVPALAPLSPVEILGNAANLHSFLLYLTPWLFLARPRTWWTAAALGGVAVLVGLTEIQTILFVPLLALRRPSLRSLPVTAAALVAACCQVVTSLLYPRTPPAGATDSVRDVAVGYVLEPFAQSFVGNSASVGAAVARWGALVVVVPFLGALGYLAVALWRGSARHRLLIGALLWGSAITWSASVLVNHIVEFRFAEYTAAQLRALGTSRYAAVGSLFLLAALVVATDVYLGAAERPLRLIGWAAAVGVVVVFVVNVVPSTTTRDQGPLWSPQIQNARVACAAHNAPPGILIQEAPHPPWSVVIPCAMIERVG